jgi:hypothetical protein
MADRTPKELEERKKERESERKVGLHHSGSCKREGIALIVRASLDAESRSVIYDYRFPLRLGMLAVGLGLPEVVPLPAIRIGLAALGAAARWRVEVRRFDFSGVA